MTEDRNELVGQVADLLDEAGTPTGLSPDLRGPGLERYRDIQVDIHWLLRDVPEAEQQAILDDAAKVVTERVVERARVAASAREQGSGRPQ